MSVEHPQPYRDGEPLFTRLPRSLPDSIERLDGYLEDLATKKPKVKVKVVQKTLKIL